MPKGHAKKGYRGHPLPDRFWLKVDNFGGVGCWNWKKPRKRKNGNVNTGSFYMDDTVGQISTNRAAWLLAYGKIPEGLHVLHRCDNPACVRPDHLFLGTHQDNMDDRRNKGRGRSARGESNHHAKLSEEEVLQIRSSTDTTAELARRYNIGWTAVDAARRGRTWRHLASKSPKTP